YPLRIFSYHTPSPLSPWGISTSITPSQTHFLNSPPKISQFLPPTSTGLQISAFLSSMSTVASLSFLSTPPPALVSLTSPLPTQLQPPSSKAGKLPSRPLGQTMFPSSYYFLYPFFAHYLLLPIVTNNTVLLL